MLLQGVLDQEITLQYVTFNYFIPILLQVCSIAVNRASDSEKGQNRTSKRTKQDAKGTGMKSGQNGGL